MVEEPKPEPQANAPRKGWIEELIDEEFWPHDHGSLEFHNSWGKNLRVLFGSFVIKPFGVASTHGLCA
jgi:hypothetical protein